MLVLNANAVRSALSMEQAIREMKRAFEILSAGDADVPERTWIEVPRVGGTTLFMPAYNRRDDSMALKIVSVFPGNRSLGLPSINALVALVNTATGKICALLDGTVLTAIRTGAAVGAATDILALPGARTAVVFGAGVQGRTQLEGVCAVRAIDRAWVVDPDRRAADAFVREMSEELGIDVSVAEDPNKAVAEADVVCTVTTSATPVFEDRAVRPGTHINAVGVYKPNMHEIPPETVARSSVFVDSTHACLEEAGDLIIAMEMGLLPESGFSREIGRVFAGSAPGREGEDEITLFKSVGIAIQDVLAASAVHRRALETGAGEEIDI